MVSYPKTHDVHEGDISLGNDAASIAHDFKEKLFFEVAKFQGVADEGAHDGAGGAVGDGGGKKLDIIGSVEEQIGQTPAAPEPILIDRFEPHRIERDSVHDYSPSIAAG